MDEVEALSKTVEMVRSRWSDNLPIFWWDLEGGEWHVTFGSEVTLRFRQNVSRPLAKELLSIPIPEDAQQEHQRVVDDLSHFSGFATTDVPASGNELVTLQ